MPQHLWKDKTATRFLYSLPTLPKTELEAAYQASGLDFSLPWSEENPLLNCWIANEHFPICTVLIQNAKLFGIDFNAEDYEGKTALITAVKVWSSGSLPRLLVQSGSCDLDHQDETGRTALHYAYALGRAAVIAELVWHGASTTIRCCRGLRPTDMLTCTNEEICIILKSIDIYPDRDINATSNDLRTHEGKIIFTGDGECLSQNANNANKLLDKFRKRPPTHPYGKALQQALTQQLESYAGCSVIETIQSNKKAFAPLRPLSLPPFNLSMMVNHTEADELKALCGGPDFFGKQNKRGNKKAEQVCSALVDLSYSY